VVVERIRQADTKGICLPFFMQNILLVFLGVLYIQWCFVGRTEKIVAAVYFLIRLT